MNICNFQAPNMLKRQRHLIYQNCGEVIEFCDPRLGQVMENLKNFTDFEIKSHSLTVYGVCNKGKCIKS